MEIAGPDERRDRSGDAGAVRARGILFARRETAARNEPGDGPSAARLLYAAAALTALLVVAIGWLTWRDTWNDARQEVMRSAETAADDARQLLGALAQHGDTANEILRGLSDAEIRAHEAELHERLRRIPERQGDLGTFHIFAHDRDGRSLVSGSAFPAPRPDRLFLHREFNQALRGADAPPVHISGVYVGEVFGTPFFAVSRRRDGGGNGLAAGAYDGVVVVAVDVKALEAKLRRMQGKAGDAVALVRSNGEVLARSLGYDRPPPIRLPPDDPLVLSMARGEAGSVTETPSGTDGVRRLTASRHVEGWPVYVTAARPRAAIVASWWEALVAQLAIALPTALALLYMAFRVDRRHRALGEAINGLEQRVAARTAELARSERRNVEILRSIGEPLCALDPDGRVTYASDSAIAFWGRPAAEVLGHVFDEVFPAQVGSPAWEAKREGLEHGTETHLCCHSALAGRWIALDVYPRGDGGITVAFRDIHDRRLSELERRRAERAAREGEERFRLVTENAPIMLWMGTTGGRCLYVNAALRRFWGVALDQLKEFDWGTTLHPEDAGPLAAKVMEAMQSRRGFEVEARYRRADGAWRILHTVAQPRFGPSGELLGMIGVNADVTEARDAEATLRASEERLRMAQEAGGIGTWEADLRTGERRWSNSNYRLWGLEPGTPLDLERIFSMVHPDDQRHVVAMTEAGRKLCAGRLPEMEFRITRASDGAVRRILSWGEVILGPDGQPARHLGVMQDVTERRAAEERLRLLAREVDHRAKNALAVVQAALRLAPKDDAQAYAHAVEGRVRALARTHGLLAEGRWEGAALRALVEGELAVFLDSAGLRAPRGAGQRVDALGPELSLAPAAAQAISMALHELATNATKYGALSVAGGHVTVRWEVDRAAGKLRLSWQERGGPALEREPSRRGFGSRVFEAMMCEQLGGSMKGEWRPEGLLCRFELPLSRVLAEEPAVVA
jgi:PAS domain S-box-containing protein